MWNAVVALVPLLSQRQSAGYKDEWNYGLVLGCLQKGPCVDTGMGEADIEWGRVGGGSLYSRSKLKGFWWG